MGEEVKISRNEIKKLSHGKRICGHNRSTNAEIMRTQGFYGLDI